MLHVVQYLQARSNTLSTPLCVSLNNQLAMCVLCVCLPWTEV